MDINATNAVNSVLSQIAAQQRVQSTAQSAVQPVSQPRPVTHTAPLQNISRTLESQELDADQALTYTLSQLRSARQSAMQSGAIKGSLINVYA